MGGGGVGVGWLGGWTGEGNRSVHPWYNISTKSSYIFLFDLISNKRLGLLVMYYGLALPYSCLWSN